MDEILHFFIFNDFKTFAGSGLPFLKLNCDFFPRILSKYFGWIPILGLRIFIFFFENFSPFFISPTIIIDLLKILLAFSLLSLLKDFEPNNFLAVIISSLNFLISGPLIENSISSPFLVF